MAQNIVRAAKLLSVPSKVTVASARLLISCNCDTTIERWNSVYTFVNKMLAECGTIDVFMTTRMPREIVTFCAGILGHPSVLWHARLGIGFTSIYELNDLGSYEYNQPDSYRDVLAFHGSKAEVKFADSSSIRLVNCVTPAERQRSLTMRTAIEYNLNRYLSFETVVGGNLEMESRFDIHDIAKSTRQGVCHHQDLAHVLLTNCKEGVHSFSDVYYHRRTSNLLHSYVVQRFGVSQSRDAPVKFATNIEMTPTSV